MSNQRVEKIRHDWAASDKIRDEGLTVPESLKCNYDISYGPYDTDNLLDVYYLKETKKNQKTIISIHGGGYVYGDKELYSHYCMSLAERGFTVVNFNYRLAPEHRFPAQLEDIFMVFKWVKQNADEYFIDLNNMFLVGDSAGGQLALHTLTILNSKEFASKFPFEVVDDFRFNACGLNCGCYNLCVNSIIPPIEATGTKDYLPEDYKKVLPMLKVGKYLNSDFPPVYLMTAEEDFLKFMAKPFERVLKRKHIEHEFHIYGEKGNKEIGHVFHLNMRLKEGILCNDNECEFFNHHLKEVNHV